MQRAELVIAGSDDRNRRAATSSRQHFVDALPLPEPVQLRQADHYMLDPGSYNPALCLELAAAIASPLFRCRPAADEYKSPDASCASGLEKSARALHIRPPVVTTSTRVGPGGKMEDSVRAFQSRLQARAVIERAASHLRRADH
jgi:hypothetical protein